MKKLFLFLTLLILPIVVNAGEYKITDHLISSEIEIAGGLNVKELIVVEGETDHVTRTINNYSFDGGKWDGKSVNLDNGTIYNSESIVELHVTAYKIGNNVDFSNFSNTKNGFFSLQDPKNLKSTKVYTLNDNKNGSETINIFYPTKKGERIAYYLDYVVSNVVVEHQDIMELNYTFKNININADSTLFRLLIPYPTNEKEYNIWIHGNQKAKASKMLNASKQNIGIMGQFPTEAKEINVRVTLPKNQVGLNMYIHKSNIKALDQIIALEDTKKQNTSESNKIYKYMIYVLYGIAIIYILSSIILFKYHNNILFIFYIIFGLFLMVFNYLFKYNNIYLYLAIIIPLIIKLITCIKGKKKSKKIKK